MGRVICRAGLDGDLIVGVTGYGTVALLGAGEGGAFVLDAENAEKLRAYLANKRGTTLEEKLAAEFGKIFDAELFTGILKMRGIAFRRYIA